MDLLRDSPFTLLCRLSSLPHSMTLWEAHNPTQIFFFPWQLCGSKEEALGELILCQAALVVALISSWKSLGSAEDSAIDRSRSPDLSLTPHWLPQAHWNTWGHLILYPSDGGTVLWRNYGLCRCPRLCQIFIPPTQSQREQFDTEACSAVLQQKKSKYFFPPHIFSNISLVFFTIINTLTCEPSRTETFSVWSFISDTVWAVKSLLPHEAAWLH